MSTPINSPTKKRIPMRRTNATDGGEDTDMSPTRNPNIPDGNSDFSIIPGDELIIHDVPRDRKKAPNVNLTEAINKLQREFDGFYDKLPADKKADAARIQVIGPEKDVGNNYLYALIHPLTPGIDEGPMPDKLVPYVLDFKVSPYQVRWNPTVRGKDKLNRLTVKDLDGDHKDGIKDSKKREEIMKFMKKKGFPGLTGHFAFRDGLVVTCETLEMAVQYAKKPFPEHREWKFTISKPSQLDVLSYGQLSVLGTSQGYVANIIKRYFDENLTDQEGNRFSFDTFKDEHAEAIHIWTGDADLSKAALTKEFGEEFQQALTGHNLKGPFLTWRLNEGGGSFRSDRQYYEAFEKKIERASGIMNERIDRTDVQIRNMNQRLIITEERQIEMAATLFDHSRSIMNLASQQAITSFRIESHRQQSDLTVRQTGLLNRITYLQLESSLEITTAERKEEIRGELAAKSMEYKSASEQLEKEVEASRFIIDQEESMHLANQSQMMSPARHAKRITNAIDEDSDEDMGRTSPVLAEADVEQTPPASKDDEPLDRQNTMDFEQPLEDGWEDLTLGIQGSNSNPDRVTPVRGSSIDGTARNKEKGTNPKERRKPKTGSSNKIMLVGNNLLVPGGKRRRDLAHPYSSGNSSPSDSRKSSRQHSPARSVEEGSSRQNPATLSEDDAGQPQYYVDPAIDGHCTGV